MNLKLFNEEIKRMNLLLEKMGTVDEYEGNVLDSEMGYEGEEGQSTVIVHGGQGKDEKLPSLHAIPEALLKMHRHPKKYIDDTKVLLIVGKSATDKGCIAIETTKADLVDYMVLVTECVEYSVLTKYNLDDVYRYYTHSKNHATKVKIELSEEDIKKHPEKYIVRTYGNTDNEMVNNFEIVETKDFNVFDWCVKILKELTSMKYSKVVEYKNTKALEDATKELEKIKVGIIKYDDDESSDYLSPEDSTMLVKKIKETNTIKETSNDFFIKLNNTFINLKMYVPEKNMQKQVIVVSLVHEGGAFTGGKVKIETIHSLLHDLFNKHYFHEIDIDKKNKFMVEFEKVIAEKTPLLDWIVEYHN